MEAFLQFGAGTSGPYLTVRAEGVKEALMEHHKRGLSYTSTGYGKKIPTIWKVRYSGKWRRVYCAQFSNNGTIYVRLNGEDVVVCIIRA